MLLEWNPPLISDQNGIIRQYLVQITNTHSGHSDSYNVSADNTSLLILDLHPAYTYGVEMAARTILPGSFSDEIFVTMREDSK